MTDLASLPRLRPVPAVAETEPYRVPRHRAPTDLRLDGNEGAAPALGILGDLAHLGNSLPRYPSSDALAVAIAARQGVDPERVLVCAGADDALDRACRALLAPGRAIVLTRPSFEMLPRYARLAGVEPTEVEWLSGPFPVDAVLARVTPATAAIAVVSPNNPTGAVATADDVDRLAAAAPHAAILVDQAYGEFGGEDLRAAALARPNGLVFRTFSKAAGLAALRVGYVLGAPEVIGWLRTAGPPYPVAGPSLHLALASLEADRGRGMTFVAAVQRERTALASLLVEAGARPLASQANFVLAFFADASLVFDALAGLGIAVRRFPDHPLLRDALRITCPGEAAAFARLSHALRSALAPQAVVFTLDSVLADVAPSRGGANARRARAALAQLATHLPLAAVSERAHADSLRLLRDAGIDDLFAVLVCREDLATDPRPLPLALHRLGAQRTWFLADSPDGVRAARAASVVPFGVVPAGSDGDAERAALLDAGAARILSAASEIAAVLP